MKTLAEIGTVAVALSGAVAVFVISRRTFSEIRVLGNPTALALCTAVLAFFGMFSLGPFILLPAGVLACACLLLPLLFNERVHYLYSRLSRAWARGTRSRPMRLPERSARVPIRVSSTTPRVDSPAPANASASPTLPVTSASAPAARRQSIAIKDPILPLDIMPHSDNRGPDRH